MVEGEREEVPRPIADGPSNCVRVQAFGKSHIGRVRRHNEDRFLIADLTAGHVSQDSAFLEHNLGQRGSLFIVADGMGGAAAGEVASQMATGTIYRQLVESWLTDERTTPQGFVSRLKKAVEAANSEIHSHATSRRELRGMGTTATAAVLLDDHVYLAQVGDSRAYLVREGRAHQLTKDQSLVQRLLDAGTLTEDEAATSEHRNVLLQALGPTAHIQMDLTYQPVRRGDVLVLCSDGLSTAVALAEIARVVAPEGDLAAACEKLIVLANERGGRDNITVVLVKLQGEGLEPPSEEEVDGVAYPLTALDRQGGIEPGSDGRGRESRKVGWWRVVRRRCSGWPSWLARSCGRHT